MLQQMAQRWWGTMKPYYTTVYQELWVSLIPTTYLYYKISYGGKKAKKNKNSDPGHH